MFFLILTITFLISSKIHLLQLVAPIADVFHSQCLSSAPSGDANEIVTALVCAEPIQSEFFKNFFFKSSLFHLIVVSKTHFTFVSLFFIFLLQKLKTKHFQVFLILFAIFYLFMCKLQAPLVRSLISIALVKANFKFKLHLSAIKILMASAIICLSLNPLWIESLSLLHSVSCALAFALVQNLKCNPFEKHFYAYLLTIPFLFGWGSIHPTGVIVNIFLTPILVFTWIPFAFLVFFIHPLMPLFDAYILFSIKTLTQFLDSVELLTETHHISSWILWSLFWGAGLFGNIRWQLYKQGTFSETK